MMSSSRSGFALPASELAAELAELRSLLEVTRLVLENYMRASRGTAVEPAARNARRRLEKALDQCSVEAERALGPTPPGPGSFDCHFCGAQHDLERDLKEFREKGEVAAVLLMRKFRYRFDHAARAIAELKERGFVEETGPSFVLATEREDA